jgi:hypothetical protein
LTIAINCDTKGQDGQFGSVPAVPAAEAPRL